MNKTPVLLIVVMLWIFCNCTSAEIVQGIEIEFVPIGNTGNPQDTLSGKDQFGQPIISPYGSVSYNYLIGKFEITNTQWDEFVAAAGEPGGYHPSAYGIGSFFSGSQQPTTGVSWFEAIQFCNYLTSGDKSKGAYKFDNSGQLIFQGIDRAAAIATYGTIYVLPTEDEWYKAAYYKSDGSGYSLYANGENTTLISDYGWNFHGGAYSTPWNVGTGSIEQNGTFDMMGNVWEWTETSQYMDASNLISIKRGGSFNSNGAQLASYNRSNDLSNGQLEDVGFRIVSITIPEPASLLLLALGGIALRYRQT